MIVPIGSDTHDGSIGWFSLSVILVCFVVFGLTWSKQTDYEVSLQTDSLGQWTATELRKMCDSIYLEQHPGARDQPRGARHGLGLLSDVEKDWSASGSSEPGDASSPIDASALLKQAAAESGEKPQATDTQTTSVRYEDTAHPMGRTDPEITLEMLELQAKIKADRRLASQFDQRLKNRARSTVGASPLVDWGFVPARAWLPGLITSIFLHASWGHLIGNMLFFFAFGVTLERWFGMGKFIAFFLLGGVVASLIPALFGKLATGQWSTIPSVGASGAIAATMGAYMRLFPKSKIKVAWLAIRAGTGMLPAWIFLGIWAITQIVEGHLLRHQEGGVGYGAHLAGFGFGILASFVIPRDPASIPLPDIRPSVDRDGLVEQMVVRIPIDEAWASFEAGDSERAREQFTRQFHEWLRRGERGLDDIARNMERILQKSPLFRFDSIPALEWGIALSKTRHLAVALEFLHMASDPDHPLPQGLAGRRDDLIHELETRQAQETPARLAPSSPPPPTSAVAAKPMAPAPSLPPLHKAPASDRKDWLVD